jgi:hypothetical protein
VVDTVVAGTVLHMQEELAVLVVVQVTMLLQVLAVHQAQILLLVDKDILARDTQAVVAEVQLLLVLLQLLLAVEVEV